MVATSPHPSNDQLSAFLQGRLPESTRREVETHIADCDSCCQRLDDVEEHPLEKLAREGADLWSERDEVGKSKSCGEEFSFFQHPRYRILARLGQGGMGEVFKARHLLMDRIVALKIVHPHLLAHPDADRRFEREFRAAARLSHPNIVAAFDADQMEQRRFFVMEFVEGQTLAERVAQEGPLPCGEARQLIRQAATALQHAHERRLVHRDIKPSNLMLTNAEDGTSILKIMDFGLVKIDQVGLTGTPVSHEQDTQLSLPRDQQETQADGVLGTLAYIAPEQLDDARSADIRADIYSLGCTFFFLLTGRTPHRGHLLLDKIQQKTTSPAESLLRERSDLPADVVATIEKMLATDPDDRYQTPAEVLQALTATAVPESIQPRAPGRPAKYWGIPATAAFLVLLLSVTPLVWPFFFGIGTEPEAPPQPTADVHTLLVIPATEMWYADVEPLRKILQDAGIAVTTAASQRDVPIVPGSGSQETVFTVDRLIEDVRAEHYDVIIACGGDWAEMGEQPMVAAKLNELFKQQLAEQQWIGSICGGQTVLGQLGLLDGRAAARPPEHIINPAWDVTWVESPTVVVDERTVTARDPDDAILLANKLLELLHMSD